MWLWISHGRAMRRAVKAIETQVSVLDWTVGTQTRCGTQRDEHANRYLDRYRGVPSLGLTVPLHYMRAY